ncbi:MAG: universal stress protein [Alphaproteobacteria bacterium]
MAISRILVPLSGGEAGLPCVETAFLLGRRFQAHVEAMHARRNPRESLAYVGEGMTGAMIEEIIAAAEREGEALAHRAREDFETLCRRYQPDPAEKAAPGRFSTSLRVEEGREAELVARRGRLADLIVVGRASKNSEAPSPATVEAALLETGRPIVVTPPDAVSSLEGTAVIAWNGSAEAARATACALPLLTQASQVVVLTISEGAGAGPDEADLVGYLAAHGVAATTRATAASFASVGESLLAEARSLDASLIVMGAYTHSRLHQIIMGGATRHVLTASELPLLMAH